MTRRKKDLPAPTDTKNGPSHSSGQFVAPATPSDPNAPFDLKLVAAWRELDEVFFERLKTLLGRFLGETRSRLEKVAEMARKSDWDSVRSLAHTLKGTTGTLGAFPLSRLCGEMESNAHRDPPVWDDSLFERIQVELVRADRAYSDLFQ